MINFPSFMHTIVSNFQVVTFDSIPDTSPLNENNKTFIRIDCKHRGFIKVFSRKAIYYWFSQAGITFWTELCSKKNFHLCGQARLGRKNHCHSRSIFFQCLALNMTRYITDKKRGFKKNTHSTPAYDHKLTYTNVERYLW